MANSEHLGMIKQGATFWNHWREWGTGSVPDLSGANLTELDLTGLDLSRANLRQVDMINAKAAGAILTGADLTFANLTGANLINARLAGAALVFANLYQADLSGSDLSNAQLIGANLNHARVDGADFSGSVFYGTTIANLDLRTVKGLESAEHIGPSSIGIDTIFRSGAEIPEVFLRGAGVPDEFIEYVKSRSIVPVEFYSCFISYSTKDVGLAERLHTDLQAQHVRCWFAPEDLKIGDKFRQRIDEAIRIYDKLLLVLSENSIESDWVEDEVEAALEKERKNKRTVLFPIKLDDAVMKTAQAWATSIRLKRHIGDFRKWKEHDEYQKAFDRLLRDLRAEDPKPKMP